MRERTLVLIKPDAINRGLIGEIISRFEKKGLKIVGMKMLKMSKSMAKEHYSHHIQKSFYPELEAFMTLMPIIAMVIEGKNSINVVRKIVGVTNGRDANPGSIRGDYSMSVSKNLIHASDSKENAKKEIKIFFKDNEIFEYSLSYEHFLYASDE